MLKEMKIMKNNVLSRLHKRGFQLIMNQELKRSFINTVILSHSLRERISITIKDKLVPLNKDQRVIILKLNTQSLNRCVKIKEKKIIFLLINLI
jgi:hypothetical protein